MTTLNEADAVRLGTSVVDKVYIGDELMWPEEVPAFSPLDLAGCTVWVDASQLPLGSVGAAWENLGSGGDGVVVGSPSPQVVAPPPEMIGAKRVMRFKMGEGRIRGTGMCVDGSFDLSVFHVTRMRGPTVGRMFTNTYPPFNFLVGSHTTADETIYDNGWLGGTAWAVPTPFKLYEGVSSNVPRVTRLYINSLERGDGVGSSAGHDNRWNISGYDATGAEETCDIDMGELIAYNRTLSPAERIQVEQYLTAKWLMEPVDEAFSPEDVTGLKVWFDAAQLALADGADVLTWPDASGDGHHATAEDTNKPKYRASAFNGHPAVEFIGANPQSRMRVPGWGTLAANKTEYTLFFVLQGRGNYGNYPVLSTAPVDTVWHWLTEFGPNGDFYWGHQNGQYRLYSALIGNADKILISLHHGSGGSFFHVNELLKTVWTGSLPAAVANVPGDVMLGGYTAAQPLGNAMYLCEVIWYDHAITEGERVQVQTYLKEKWGL